MHVCNSTTSTGEVCVCGFKPSEKLYKNQLFIFTFLMPFSIIFFCYFNIGNDFLVEVRV